jgi:PAS domain-containing protein
MDDLQFMNDFLGNEASFMDISEHQQTSTKHVGEASVITSSTSFSAASMVTQGHGHQQSLGITGPLNQPLSLYPKPQQQAIPQEASRLPTEDSVSQNKTTGATVVPSPLTARLNYPFVPSSAGMKMGIAPAISSKAAHRDVPCSKIGMSAESSTSTHFSSRKRWRDQTQNISEDEGDRQKRRLDRNLREQQRSQKITEQIGYLRDFLASANVHFKPDKYSTLVGVVEYIRQLQSRAQMLDAEHKTLLETISRTNELANSRYYQASADGETTPVSNEFMSNGSPTENLDEEHPVYVGGLDYHNVFKQCGIALAIASIDGRFIDCNQEFESMTGYKRQELLPLETSTSAVDHSPSSSPTISPSSGVVRKNLSLFNILRRQDMEQIFLAMSQMLRQNVILEGADKESSLSGCLSDCIRDYWSGSVAQSRRKDTQVCPALSSSVRSLNLKPNLEFIPIGDHECVFNSKPRGTPQVFPVLSFPGSR